MQMKQARFIFMATGFDLPKVNLGIFRGKFTISLLDFLHTYVRTCKVDIRPREV